MVVRVKPTKSILLILWSVLLTSLSVAFGGPALIGVRSAMGAFAYWTLNLAIGLSFWFVGFPLMAVIYFGVTTLVGVYFELRKKQKSALFEMGIVSVVSAAVVCGFGLVVWVKQQGQAWYSLLVENTQKLLDQSLLIDPSKLEVPLTAEMILVQAPSAFILLMALTLLLALLFEKKILNWLKLPVPERAKLTSFTLPDICVWMLMAALLGYYAPHEVELVRNISVNLLNIIGFLYIFQGLAVVIRFMELQNVGTVWRVFWLLFIILNLFVVVGFIGLLDYWFDFRKRMDKKASKIRKTQNGESQ